MKITRTVYERKIVVAHGLGGFKVERKCVYEWAREGDWYGWFKDPELSEAHINNAFHVASRSAEGWQPISTHTWSRGAMR